MVRSVPNDNVLGISFVSNRDIQGIDILLPSGTRTFVETKISDRTKRISLQIGRASCRERV